jgi:hypothetical protein
MLLGEQHRFPGILKQVRITTHIPGPPNSANPQ